MQHRLASPDNSLFWLDVVNPTAGELKKIAQEFGLHPTSVKACLKPEHLPKFERMGNVSFLILRAYDEQALASADTVQELTRKVAIFVLNGGVITIHRKDQRYFKDLRAKWEEKIKTPPENPRTNLLGDLLEEIFSSYEPPVDQAQNELEASEMGLFGAEGAAPFSIQTGYYLKRRASVFKRMLRISMDVLAKFTTHCEQANAPLFQSLKEKLDSLYFYADDLTEGTTSLLNLHLALASQKTNEASRQTNEVMRVLTVISVIILPLNLVVGIYGMNFAHMPELQWRYGYFFAIALLVLIAAGLFIWVKRRGWLGEEEL